MKRSKQILPDSKAEYWLAGFLALRLLLALLTVRDPTGGVLTDSRGYLGLTNRLWETGIYSNPANSEPDLLRPPGYPMILFALRSIAGPSQALISLVQLAVSGLASWGLLLIGKQIGRDRVGLLGAWLFASSPNVALWSLTVMTEVWLALLMVAALALVAEDVKRGQVKWPVYSGLLLGLASYIRPIAVVIVPIWSALAIVWARWTTSMRKALISVAGLVIICFTVMLPWALRNWNVHDQFLFSTVTRKTWLGFNLAEVISMADGVSRDAAVAELNPDRSMLSLTLEVALEHPSEFVRAQLFGAARTVVGLDIGTWGNVLDRDDWIGLGLLSSLFEGEIGNPAGRLRGSWEDPQSRLRLGIMAASLAYTLFLFGLALLALPASRQMERPEQFLMTFAAVTAVVLLLTPLAAGQARFRVPAEPFLAFIAGYGWMWLAGRQIGSAQPRIIVEEPNPLNGEVSSL